MLHNLKVVHRDIKAANVLLNKDGSVKLGDLNASKRLVGFGMKNTQTGTPYYASPEVWRDQPYDYKSDIWGLGCILYEMATFRPPFDGPNMQSLFESVCSGKYEPIPSTYSRDLS